jgi:hypothetical protein
MDERTRQNILRSFPEDALIRSYENHCKYINMFSRQPCLRQTSMNLPACSHHISDFYLYEQTKLDTSFFPQQTFEFTIIEPIHPLPNYLEIPKAIESSNDCGICFETKELLSLPCRHVCCHSCVKSLTINQCPICRLEIIFPLIKRI